MIITLVAELMRRTQWALLRVENEAINNFESYRSIYIIPPMVDDERD
jgi:hypothetical protein